MAHMKLFNLPLDLNRAYRYGAAASAMRGKDPMLSERIDPALHELKVQQAPRLNVN